MGWRRCLRRGIFLKNDVLFVGFGGCSLIFIDVRRFLLKSQVRGHYIALQGHFFPTENVPLLKNKVLGHYVALQGHFFFTENVPLLKNKVLGHYVALQGHFFSQKTGFVWGPTVSRYQFWVCRCTHPP